MLLNNKFISTLGNNYKNDHGKSLSRTVQVI